MRRIVIATVCLCMSGCATLKRAYVALYDAIWPESVSASGDTERNK